MAALDKYYIHMDDLRYYWCSTLLELMRRGYRYYKAKHMILSCPLTEKIQGEGGWAYFHDMDYQEWADMICQWNQQKEDKRTLNERLRDIGIIRKYNGSLHYMKEALNPENENVMKWLYRQKKLRWNKKMKKIKSNKTDCVA